VTLLFLISALPLAAGAAVGLRCSARARARAEHRAPNAHARALLARCSYRQADARSDSSPAHHVR
jgi:hypothetical protein